MVEAVADRATIYQLAIPLRRRIDHDSQQHTHAEPVLVTVELRDGTVGWGEAPCSCSAIPGRSEAVAACIRDVYVPALASFHATSFADALEKIDAMPWHDARGQSSPTVRAAVELALLDASLKRFDRTMDDAVRWMDLPGFGRPGSLPGIRFTAVIHSRDRRRARRELRLFRWRGFRSFKLTVASPGDRDILHDSLRTLRGDILRGKRTLRIECNAAWSVAQAESFLKGIDPALLAGIEQPLPRGREGELAGLRRKFRIPIIHDESLVSEGDAHRLLELEVADLFNVGIAKCGGLMPALRVAHLGARGGTRIILGAGSCETGILAGAGLAFLDACPVIAAEGCFGRQRLKTDLVRPSCRLGVRGGAPRLRESWATGLDPVELRALSRVPPEQFVF